MKRKKLRTLEAGSVEEGPGTADGKRARTRAALIDAAVQLIAEEGYERLSMEKVAARAGMTKGSIYGNFTNKEDLIMAAFLAAFPRRPPPSLQPGDSLAKQLQIIAEGLIAQAPQTRSSATKLVAFHLYALTHEEMRTRVATENAAIYKRMEDWIGRMFPSQELPMAPAHFARLLHVLSNGLLVAHALAPESIDADAVRAIFAALVRDTASRATAAHKDHR